MNRQTQIKLLLILLYFVVFLPGLGLVNLFDWDEVNFAEAAREMLETGNWLDITINYEPFWEKPPLFIWLQALSMKLFGVGAFAARFPNFITGLATFAFLYRISFKRFGLEAALGTVLLYAASITPQLYFRSGIIDPLFNLLIFLSIYELIKTSENSSARNFFFSGLLLGLAVMTKGPVAILIVGLAGLAYQLSSGHKFYAIKDLALLLFGLILVPGIWFGLITIRSGAWFVKEFIHYQAELFLHPVASHGQPFYYHALVLIILCFPLTLVALPAITGFRKWKTRLVFDQWTIILFWVVLLLFSMVTTKIVHYSSLCYIPLALMGGKWLSQHKPGKWQSWSVALAGIGVYGSISVLAYLLAGSGGREWIGDHVKDPFFSIQLSELGFWPLSTAILSFCLLLLILLFVYMARRQFHQGLILLLAITVTLGIYLRQTIPAVDLLTQGVWIEQLKTYKEKEMFHFTYGFKSYAQYYYTQIPESEKHKEVKSVVLTKLGIRTFYEMSEKNRKEYELLLREHVLFQTDFPFTLTVKQSKEVPESYKQLLMEVFRGNGYTVYERRVD